jgi:hypothetical protein
MDTIRLRYEGPVDAFRNVMWPLDGWRSSSDEKIGILRVGRPRYNRDGLNHQTDVLSTWIAVIESDGRSVPDSRPRRAATFKAFKITPEQITTDVEVLDGTYLSEPCESLAATCDELCTEIAKRLINGGCRILFNSADEIKPLDVSQTPPQEGVRDTAGEVVGLDQDVDAQAAQPKTMNADDKLDGLIKLIKEAGLGHRPESDLEMAAAWLAWNTTPKSERPKLETWLSDKFGVDEHGTFNVLTDNFHSYKRKVPPERIAQVEEKPR